MSKPTTLIDLNGHFLTSLLAGEAYPDESIGEKTHPAGLVVGWLGKLILLMDSTSWSSLGAFNVVMQCCFHITSIAARGGGGSFKRLKLYNSEEHVPIESFVTTLIHWTFFSDDANKVGICWLCRSGQLHVTPSFRWSLPRCHRSVRNDMNSTQYNSVLQSSEKCYPSTILYYFAKYYSRRYYSSTTKN